MGDLETDNDGLRLRRPHAPVAQITTGGTCHLDAGMVARGVEALDLEGVKVLFIENVGNLVCPASFDLGEQVRVVLLSCTEGEDKPLKYPPIFKSADLVLLTHTGLEPIGRVGAALSAIPLREPVRISLRRIPRREVPTGDEFTAWLDARWAECDTEIEARLGGRDAEAAVGTA